MIWIMWLGVVMICILWLGVADDMYPVVRCGG